MSHKTFVLDTNVLLYDSQALHAFKDNDVVIPFAILSELDDKKTRQDEVGKNARTIIRALDDLRQQGNLFTGVKLPGGGTLTVKGFSSFTAFVSVDDQIIEVAKTLKEESSNTQNASEIILVTKDVNVRVKCDALGITCDDYLKHRVAKDADQLYKGVQRVTVPAHDIAAFYKTGRLALDNMDEDPDAQFFPNQFIVAKDHPDSSQSAIARYVGPGKDAKKLIEVEEAWGLKPRNKEQKFAFDLLFDNDVKLVSLVGAAGTGKTLLAVAAGVEQVLGDKKYDKLIIMRPVFPLGKDIGFLPGTMEEKMEPWVAPIVDNLKFLFASHDRKKTRDDDAFLQMCFEKKIIEVEAMTYIRGRSIPNAYIIIDECQNLTAHELKALVTRAGDGTKIVLTGDIEQIDNTYVDSVSNGLTFAVDKFKPYEVAGHVTLIKGERSRLATLAAEIL